MKRNAFFSIRVPKAQEVLADLHQEVVLQNGRVEMFSDDLEGTSVIISKQELQSLEKALAILSDGDAIQQLHEMLRVIGKSTAGAVGAGV